MRGGSSCPDESLRNARACSPTLAVDDDAGRHDSAHAWEGVSLHVSA
jgi:hypothetical protein